MIRTIVTPQQQNISIDLSPEYVGKKVEVIAFAVEEMEDEIDTYFTSENILAKDWLTPEENAA